VVSKEKFEHSFSIGCIDGTSVIVKVLGGNPLTNEDLASAIRNVVEVVINKFSNKLWESGSKFIGGESELQEGTRVKILVGPWSGQGGIYMHKQNNSNWHIVRLSGEDILVNLDELEVLE